MSKLSFSGLRHLTRIVVLSVVVGLSIAVLLTFSGVGVAKVQYDTLALVYALAARLYGPLPGVAATDILVRVQNNEFYSPANDLPFQLPVPGHWPPGAVVKTEDADLAPPLDLLERHIDFFAAIEAKEMLVTPKGVRLVRLIDQGERAEYMVLRIADFRRINLEPAVLSDMMDRALALADDIGRVATDKSQ